MTTQVLAHGIELLDIQQVHAIAPAVLEAGRGSDAKEEEEELRLETEHTKQLDVKADEEAEGVGYGLTDQTNRLPPLRVALVFFVLGVCVLLSVLESSIVATSLSTISSDLKAGSQASWIITVYMLTQCSLSPCWSRLSDILGRKVLLNFCLIEFLVMSLGCALSTNISMLLAFRALQGIGGGALLVLAQAITLDIVTIRDRSKYQVIFEAMVTIGNGIGPILGGVFAEINWRLCFYINLPFGVFALVMSFILIPAIPVSGHWKEKLNKIDFAGCGLITVGSVLILLAMSWGGVTYPWVSPAVLVTLILGFVTWGIFGYWESRRALIPILPMRLFRNPTVCAILTVAFWSSGMNTYLLVFYVPQYLQLVQGFAALKSGIFLLAYLVPITVVVFASAMVVLKTGRCREMIWIGLALNAVAIGLISTLDENASEARILGYLIFAGASFGPTLQTAVITAQASVEKRDLTVVTGARLFMKNLGGLFGIAISSSLLQNEVSAAPISADQLASVLDNPVALRTNLDAAAIQIVLTYYKRGFKQVFLAGTIVGIFSFVVAVIGVKHYPLDGGSKEEKAIELKAHEESPPSTVAAVKEEW